MTENYIHQQPINRPKRRVKYSYSSVPSTSMYNNIYSLLNNNMIYVGIIFIALQYAEDKDAPRAYMRLHKNTVDSIAGTIGVCWSDFYVAVRCLEKTGIIRMLEDSNYLVIELTRLHCLCSCFDKLPKWEQASFVKHLFEGNDEYLAQRYGYIGPPSDYQSQIKSQTYLMIDNSNGRVKIGKSQNPMQREATLQSQKPDIHLIAICDNDVERFLHKHYKDFCIRGEWYSLNEKQIKEIIQVFQFKLIEPDSIYKP